MLFFLVGTLDTFTSSGPLKSFKTIGVTHQFFCFSSAFYLLLSACQESSPVSVLIHQLSVQLFVNYLLLALNHIKISCLEAPFALLDVKSKFGTCWL